MIRIGLIMSKNTGNNNKNDSTSKDNHPLTTKLHELKDEFGNRIEDSNFESWLADIKKEVGDGIETLAIKHAASLIQTKSLCN